MNLLKMRLFNKLIYMRGRSVEGIFALSCNLVDLLLLDRRCRGEAIVVVVSFRSPSEQTVKKLSFAV